MKAARYSKYKDSGIEWLGEIPEHWVCMRVKNVATMQAGVGITSDAIEESGDYPVYGGNGLRGYTMAFTHTGNVVLVGRQGALCGNVNYASGQFWASEHAVVVEPSEDVDVRWLGETLRSMKLNDYSVAAAQPGLAVDRILALGIAVPPEQEKHAIAEFLERETTRIDTLVKKKERLIELLQEKRKNLTLDAMQSPRASSERLEIVADLIRRPINREGDATYTPIGLYNRGRGIFRKESRNGDELGDSRFFWIREGDLVISGQFAWEGAIALASEVEDGCIASHRYPILRSKPDVLDSAFLLSFFQTEWGQLLLDHHSRGAAGRNRPLNAQTLQKERIPLPPIQEQLRVAELLQREYLLVYCFE